MKVMVETNLVSLGNNIVEGADEWFEYVSEFVSYDYESELFKTGGEEFVVNVKIAEVLLNGNFILEIKHTPTLDLEDREVQDDIVWAVNCGIEGLNEGLQEDVYCPMSPCIYKNGQFFSVDGTDYDGDMDCVQIEQEVEWFNEFY